MRLTDSRSAQVLAFVMASLFSPVVALAQSLAPAFEIIEQAVADGSIPGATALVMQHGRVITQREFGVREIEPGQAFESDTVCWIASLTKPVTATAAMILVERNKLDLDAPIETYLPQFSNLSTPDGQRHSITIRQIMSHMSGIPASVPLREPFFFTQRWFDRNLPEIVDAIAARPLVFAPGTKVHYSNAAPYVLARIIEVRSGRRFGEFVESEVLKPLGMNDTGFSVATEKLPKTATVYRREKGSLSVYCDYDKNWNVKMTMPDGGLFSTTHDMAKFANSFLDTKRAVLSQDAVETMLSQQNSQYGLGWILDKDNQFSHWGSSGTLMWADKRTGVVGVFFSQIQDFALIERLRERFRDSIDAAFASSMANK